MQGMLVSLLKRDAKAAQDPVLGTAANVLAGVCTHEGVAEAFGMPYRAPNSVL